MLGAAYASRHRRASRPHYSRPIPPSPRCVGRLAAVFSGDFSASLSRLGVGGFYSMYRFCVGDCSALRFPLRIYLAARFPLGGLYRGNPRIITTPSCTTGQLWSSAIRHRNTSYMHSAPSHRPLRRVFRLPRYRQFILIKPAHYGPPRLSAVRISPELVAPGATWEIGRLRFSYYKGLSG